MAFEELQIPGEPGVWSCARHKNVHTRLRCGRCEKPICPKCTLMGPTGARCRECAGLRSSHVYQVKPGNLAKAFVAALVLGAIGAQIIEAAGTLVFWALLYAPAIVPLMSRIVDKLTGGKRGPVIAGASCAGVTIGALASSLGGTIAMVESAPPGVHAMLGPAVLMTAFTHIFVWIFIVIAVAGLWYWLK